MKQLDVMPQRTVEVVDGFKVHRLEIDDGGRFRNTRRTDGKFVAEEIGGAEGIIQNRHKRLGHGFHRVPGHMAKEPVEHRISPSLLRERDPTPLSRLRPIELAIGTLLAIFAMRDAGAQYLALTDASPPGNTFVSKLQYPLVWDSVACVLRATCTQCNFGGWGVSSPADVAGMGGLTELDGWPGVSEPLAVSCKSTIQIDQFEYPLIQTADYYGSVMIARTPSTVRNCRKATGGAPTSSGAMTLSLGTSILGMSPNVHWKPVGRNDLRIVMTTADGNVVCDGGSVPDALFYNGFDGRPVDRNYKAGFEL